MMKGLPTARSTKSRDAYRRSQYKSRRDASVHTWGRVMMTIRRYSLILPPHAQLIHSWNESRFTANDVDIFYAQQQLLL